MSDLTIVSNVSTAPSLTGLEANKPVAADVEKKAIIKEESRAVDKPEKEQVSASTEEVVAEINHFMQNMQRNLSFSVDKQLGRDIISVTDIETDEVIRQIPSEELVVLLKKMDDVAGILFDTKV